MNPGPLNLAAGEVGIWMARYESIRDPGLLAAYHRMLNPEEAAQQKRFYHERHRHQYLVTRAVIRTLLARCGPLPAESWRFEKNNYGRPHLASGQTDVNLRFNISHTEGLVVCAMTVDRELGVDVEDIKRGGGLIDIADRYFSASEVVDLHKVPEAHQEDRFFDYWTLKESYIKARGMGLSIPLGDFSFHVGEDTSIGISIAASQNDQPERWRFAQWRVAPQFKVALTLEKMNVTNHVRLFEYVPLMDERPLDIASFRSSLGG